MERPDVRAGLGLAIVGVAVVAIVGGADHFGLRLDDRFNAGLLILGLVGFVGGTALVIHAGWPSHLRLLGQKAEAWEKWIGDRPSVTDSESFDPVLLLGTWKGMTSLQEQNYVESHLSGKWVVVQGSIGDVTIGSVPLVTLSAEVRDKTGDWSGFKTRTLSMALVFEATQKPLLIELAKGKPIRAQGQVVRLWRNNFGFPHLVIGWCQLLPLPEAPPASST
jgi:hypothetical protein